MNFLCFVVPQEVLWSIWGSHQTLWRLPFPNVTWHSGTWPCTMTPSADRTLHQFANLLPNWTLLPILTLLPNFGGFHRRLQRVRLANRGRLLLQTPGPVPFGTCICSKCWDHSFLNLSCLRTFWDSNIPRYFYFAWNIPFPLHQLFYMHSTRKLRYRASHVFPSNRPTEVSASLNLVQSRQSNSITSCLTFTNAKMTMFLYFINL